MRCRRCDSPQIQRDYDDATTLITLVGMRKLLCNTCGYVFHGFDPFNILNRTPAKPDSGFSKRRLNPRYHTHLPTAISLINGTPSNGNGKVTYTDPSKGHCETISKLGMGLSLVGSRFSAEELSEVGRLLFVRIDLPAATMEGVVSILDHERLSENKKWFLAVKIHQISDTDKAKLTSYLDERSKAQPLIHRD
jgi:hypothetical protein